MEMVWQYHPAVNVEWPLGLCAAYNVAQGFDVPSEQIGATFEQVEGKEIGTTRYAVAAVIWHNTIVSPPIIRRNAPTRTGRNASNSDHNPENNYKSPRRAEARRVFRHNEDSVHDRSSITAAKKNTCQNHDITLAKTA
jgi:hypothetical protein